MDKALVRKLWNGEVQAIADYIAAYQRTGNRIFLHIAKDERHHKQELEKLLRR